MTLQQIDPANLAWLEQWESHYRADPGTLTPEMQRLLETGALPKESFPHTDGQPQQSFGAVDSRASMRIYRLIDSYRRYGHLAVNINPIARQPRPFPKELELTILEFKNEDLSISFPTLGILEETQAPLSKIIERLQFIYCNQIGYEYMDRQGIEMNLWIQQKIEGKDPLPLSIEQKKMILEQLNRSELLETFIHTKYTGQKRFSIEGGETLIPILEAAIEEASLQGVRHCVIGMAHRGRLNVLSNILKKSYAEIFSEFEEGYIPNSFQGSGDVKYHKGYSSQVTLPDGHLMHVILAPNPSHLESVDPVVEGMAYGFQQLFHDDNKKLVIPILIHGDAAIAGQGIVYETLQMCNLDGYKTGGTLHLIINNQIGFTATSDESCSTTYCTDIAATFGAPVFHVNAEDPENCLRVILLAMELRNKFHCDLFIDMNCYRKYGHNESDEPSFTQPLEYQIIRKKKPIREIYREQLIHEGVMEHQIADSLEQEFTKGLQDALDKAKAPLKIPVAEKKEPVIKDMKQETIQKVTELQLKEIAVAMSKIPSEFAPHPKIEKLIQDRLQLVQDPKKRIDWAMGELLAYGSLLCEGIDIRLVGQDSQRGTFSHRHAVWIDQQREFSYFPLQHLQETQGKFTVINSLLSENAALGFEYGFSVANPKALVIWEAQFGDFCNGAQVVIDQFITAAEQKWGQTSRLTLLLPHGYEGQGPEHSSGRMERFLCLAAEQNFRVVDPTTPAQLFHLLRHQVLSDVAKPLIIFSPKALLRLPACSSSLKELTTGSFQTILVDAPVKKGGEGAIKKLFFCTGKIYYELKEELKKRDLQDQIAIVRIEQLYPLDESKLQQLIQPYRNAKEWIWVQEEPKNMGALEHIVPQLQSLLPAKSSLRAVSRPRSAATAVGSYVIHKKQHQELITDLFKDG